MENKLETRGLRGYRGVRSLGSTLWFLVGKPGIEKKAERGSGLKGLGMMMIPKPLNPKP